MIVSLGVWTLVSNDKNEMGFWREADKGPQAYDPPVPSTYVPDTSMAEPLDTTVEPLDTTPEISVGTYMGTKLPDEPDDVEMDDINTEDTTQDDLDTLEDIPPSVFHEFYEPNIPSFYDGNSEAASCAARPTLNPSEDQSVVDCWGKQPFFFCRLRNVVFFNRTFVGFDEGPSETRNLLR